MYTGRFLTFRACCIDNLFHICENKIGRRHVQSQEEAYTISEPTASPGVTVEFLYDTAYENRYSEAAVTRITREAAVLKEFYAEEFGIDVSYGTATDFTAQSYASQCPNLVTQYINGSPRCICGCVTDSHCTNSQEDLNTGFLTSASYHHTNIQNVLYHLGEPDETDAIRVAYSGREFCLSTIEGHDISSSISGSAFMHHARAIVCQQTSTSEAREVQTLIHEVGHLFGVIDHYGLNNPGPETLNIQFGRTDFSKYCMYGDEKEDLSIINNLTICGGCRSIIESNRNQYCES